jgi:hypothetical protein
MWIPDKVDSQRTFGRRVQKSRRTGNQRGSYVTVVIRRTERDERELREERSMLVRHEGVNDLPPDLRHALCHPHHTLQFYLTRMPGRNRVARSTRVPSQSCVHDVTPVQMTTHA